MSVGSPMGNCTAFGVLQIAIDHGSVAANTSAETSVTVPGLRTNDFVAVNKPSLEAGLAVGNARVSADNTLAVQVINTTAGAIDEVSETYTVLWARPEGVVAVANE